VTDPAPPPSFVLGLDLAQASDYTALCVLKISQPEPPDSEPIYDLVALARYRGERYPAIVDRVERIAGSPKLRPPPPEPVPGDPIASFPRVDPWASGLAILRPVAPPAPARPKLVVDATGVGRAVVDMFLRPSMLEAAELVPLTITAGETWRRDRWGSTRLTGYWVGKRELVSVLVARLQGGRLRFIPGDPLAGALEEELRNFKVKVTKAANVQFEAREGEHDDLVLSVAMALWIAEYGRGKKIKVL
jgi:hypothetical protein